MRPERKYYGKTIKSGVFLCSYSLIIDDFFTLSSQSLLFGQVTFLSVIVWLHDEDFGLKLSYSLNILTSKEKLLNMS